MEPSNVPYVIIHAREWGYQSVSAPIRKCRIETSDWFYTSDSDTIEQRLLSDVDQITAAPSTTAAGVNKLMHVARRTSYTIPLFRFERRTLSNKLS